MTPFEFDFGTKGQPTVDASKCNGCGACVNVCPDQVWRLQDGKARPDKGVFLGCFACGHCLASCPKDCITVRGRGMQENDGFALADDTTISPQTLEAFLQSRRSMRKFKDAPIDRAYVERILQMTALAPMGIPPSDIGVVVFHGREQVRELTNDAIGTYRQINRFMKPWMLPIAKPFMKRRTFMQFHDFILPLADELVAAADRGEDGFAYEAPLALIFHHGMCGDMADLAICTTYAMLAAESLGLGTCMLGTPAALNASKAFKTKHGIPAQNTIGLGLIAGWPGRKFQRGIRRRLASVSWAATSKM